MQRIRQPMLLDKLVDHSQGETRVEFAREDYKNKQMNSRNRKVRICQTSYDEAKRIRAAVKGILTREGTLATIDAQPEMQKRSRRRTSANVYSSEKGKEIKSMHKEQVQVMDDLLKKVKK